MCPEYGATAALFPVDQQTLQYLRVTGREPEHIDLVERYTRAQGMFRTDGTPAPRFSELVELNLSDVEPSLAGPKRPQDRVALPRVWESFTSVFTDAERPAPAAVSRFDDEGGAADVSGREGSVAVATRPKAEVRHGSVVIAAITSCTNTSNPSVMVAAGLLAKRAVERGLKVPSWVKTSLAPGSRVVTDYLKAAGLLTYLERHIFDGDEHWKRMAAPEGPTYEWDAESTYVREPPYFKNMQASPRGLEDIVNARALVALGDSITTDHISPAGSIPTDSPAGRYLVEHGVERADFNSYGARRGNHEVLVRGTFANVRLRNTLVDREGYWTRHLPDGAEMTIHEAADRYREEGVPLVVLAGKEYGSGSSRDWAAKGPLLLGVRAVIAESFERIHRSNLVGMGVLPLEYADGASAASLGLRGDESFTIRGLAGGLRPGQQLTAEARANDGKRHSFTVRSRLDNDTDVGYLRNGGILPMVLRQVMSRPT